MWMDFLSKYGRWARKIELIVFETFHCLPKSFFMHKLSKLPTCICEVEPWGVAEVTFVLGFVFLLRKVLRVEIYNLLFPLFLE